MEPRPDIKTSGPDTNLPDRGARPARRRTAETSSYDAATSLFIAPLPRWILTETSREGKAGEDTASLTFNASFRSGAALFAFDQILRADPPWLSVLRMRLALKAAAAAARLLRFRADEAALRDAEHLTRPGDDPGPAGRLHRRLRKLASQPLHSSNEIMQSLETELGDSAKASDVLDLLKADLHVAAQLAWTVPVLLHLTAILDSSFRQGEAAQRPRTDDPTRKKLQPRVLSHACIAAHAQVLTLDRQTTALAQAVSGLRTRDGNKGLALILSDDCVAPWAMVGRQGLGSDRAARRFCDRLVEQRVLRLLTNRPTFRLYGL